MSDERRGRLVLVATPIGNLGDLSPRAREVLATADLICCEDTRRTRALLSASGITAKGPHGDRLLSLHGHNEAARLDRVAAAVAGGSTVAVVSDAGTPGISDPGAWLAAQLAAAGETVSTVPGPSVGRGRAGRERTAGRPLLCRGVPAPQGARAPPPLDVPHGGRPDDRGPRGPRAAGCHAGGAGGRRPGAANGRGPRADQAARRGVAGNPRAMRRRPSPRATSGARSSS